MADKKEYRCPSCDKKVDKIGLCPRCAEIVKNEPTK